MDSDGGALVLVGAELISEGKIGGALHIRPDIDGYAVGIYQSQIILIAAKSSEEMTYAPILLLYQSK